MKGVLVDTSAWIVFLRGGKSSPADRLDALLERDSAFICGVVEMELLRGVLSQERNRLRRLLSALPYVETLREDFVAAGERLCLLRQKGVTIPATDALIGMICLRENLSLLTLDAHFRHLAGLRLE